LLVLTLGLGGFILPPYTPLGGPYPPVLTFRGEIPCTRLIWAPAPGVNEIGAPKRGEFLTATMKRGLYFPPDWE